MVDFMRSFMKLHLPRFLTAALLAAMVSAQAYGYTSAVDDVADLRNGSGTIEGERIYQIYNGKYTLSRGEVDTPFMSGSAGDESLRFSAANDKQNEVILNFAGGTTQAFYKIDSLSFEKLKRLKFSSMSSGAIYSEGPTPSGVPSALTISGVMDDDDTMDDVYFTANSITGACGGALNANYTTINISSNGGVNFGANKALAASVSNENQNQGNTSGVGASVAQNYTISLFGFELSFQFGFNLGFSYTSDNPQTPEVEAPVDDVCGGAINLVNSSLALNGNQSVTFEENSTVDYGGAIYASPGVMSSVTINKNYGQVLFHANNTTGHIQNDHVVGGGGGAIFIGQQSSLAMNGNAGDIIFKQNLAAAAGGAIYHGGQNIQNTGDSLVWANNTGNISFDGNVAIGAGGAIHMMRGGRLAMTGNKGEIRFEQNKAGVCGGAISALDAYVTLNDNASIIFSDNLVFHQDVDSLDVDSFSNCYVGGAIYGTNIEIHNNDSVLFQRNAQIVSDDFILLRSLYVEGSYDKQLDNPDVYPTVSVSLSAGNGKTIEFRDSIYIEGAGLNLNSPQQTGDIIFTGKTTEADLAEVKRSWREYSKDENISPEVTAAEIEASRTSIVLGETILNGGRLCVEDGAIFKSAGISLTAGSNSVLRVDNATLVNIDASGNTGKDTAINVGKGTALLATGLSTIESGQLTFADGSSWMFDINNWSSRATLTFDGQLNIDGDLTLVLNLANASMRERYHLYKGTNDSSYAKLKELWMSGGINVIGEGDAKGATLDDFEWAAGSLYYNCTIVWNNAQGSREWDLTNTNWEYGRIFDDGMSVRFTDTGAGEVILTGALITNVVTVVNSEGNDYTFTGQKNAEGVDGHLTGSADLKKRGEGALTIETANDYTSTTTLEGGTLNLHNAKALGDSTLTTAEGTTLGVGGGADVVLADKNHIINGNVKVDKGSSLEIAQGCSYQAASTTIDGTLRFSVDAKDLGSLSGNGLLEVENEANVIFRGDASAFTGDIVVTGSKSSLFLDVFDGLVKAGEVAVKGGDLYLRAENQLTMAGGSILSMVAGKVGEKVANVIADKILEFATDAMLSAMLQSVIDADGDDILNENAGGNVEGAGITLHAGSTLHLENCHINLNCGTLTLNVTPQDAEKINLVLLLDDVLLDDSMVLLFSGVDNVVLGYDDDDVNGSKWYASHYFTGNMVGENTMLVYDEYQRIVYLTGVVPEPTTTTLSLLALTALAARRRRK